MYNNTSSRQNNTTISHPVNTSQYQSKTEFKDKTSLERPSNVSYHSIKYTKGSSVSKDEPKNNQINTSQYKYVNTTQKTNPPKESVKTTNYTSTKYTLPQKTEVTKKQTEVFTNQNKDNSKNISVSSNVPSAYKRSSYFVAPKENIVKENIKDIKDYKRSSSNEKKYDSKNNKYKYNKQWK